jgi:hypothetical protein
VRSLESLKFSRGQNEDKLVKNTPLNGVYQDIQLHGLNNIARSSTESETQNLIICGMKYLQERFLIQGVIERATVISDNFVWPTGSALESYCVSEVVALAHHYKMWW